MKFPFAFLIIAQNILRLHESDFTAYIEAIFTISKLFNFRNSTKYWIVSDIGALGRSKQISNDPKISPCYFNTTNKIYQQNLENLLT